MSENSVKYINLKLDSILSGLHSLTYDNFDELFPGITECVSAVHISLEKLKEKCSAEEIREMEPDLAEKTKLIKNIFDNIIEQKEQEQTDILVQLQMMQNQRKLANYR